jgi:hypothetical protein
MQIKTHMQVLALVLPPLAGQAGFSSTEGGMLCVPWAITRPAELSAYSPGTARERAQRSRSGGRAGCAPPPTHTTHTMQHHNQRCVR